MASYLVGTLSQYDKDGKRKPSNQNCIPVWDIEKLSSPKCYLRGFFCDIETLEGRTIDGSPIVFGGSDERIYSWDLDNNSSMPSTTYLLASEKRHALEDITLFTLPNGDTRLAAIADREGAETGSIFIWKIGDELPISQHLIEGGIFERDMIGARGGPKLCYDKNSGLIIYTARKDPGADPEKRSLREKKKTLYDKLNELESKREGLRGEKYRRVNEEYTKLWGEYHKTMNELKMDTYEIRSLNPKGLEEREEFCLRSSRAPILRSYNRLILIQTPECLSSFNLSDRRLTERVSYLDLLNIPPAKRRSIDKAGISISDPILSLPDGKRIAVKADRKGYDSLSDLMRIDLDEGDIERFTQDERVYDIILV